MTAGRAAPRRTDRPLDYNERIGGSSRGLGRAFAEALAAAGPSVVVNGTDPATVDSVAEATPHRGGKAIACAGSVADAKFCTRLVQACVDTFGGIGLLVNNAGLTRDWSITRMTAEEFDEVIEAPPSR